MILKLSNGQIISYRFQQRYFVLDQGTKTGATPKRSEDFWNAEQVQKIKLKSVSYYLTVTK